MPELPEVETVRRGLLPVMEGDFIKAVDVNRPDLRWPFPPDMKDRLTGAQVMALRRRSKYILADLSTKETLIIHLGMSGRMQISGANVGDYVHEHPPQAKHDHVVFYMRGGAQITFNDPRRFGAMDLAQTIALNKHKLLAHLGPEPLGNRFDETYLLGALKGRNASIKNTLLDQRIVAGLGNIYVCEALFRAKISPLKVARKVPHKKSAALIAIIRTVLQEAIAAGGSSLRDHRQADGDLGYFQHSFQVYGREGKPCKQEGCTGKIKRVVQSGRSSFYCPSCQR